MSCVFSTETHGTFVHKRGNFLHSPSLLRQWWQPSLWLNCSFSLMHSRSLEKDWWIYETVTNCIERSPYKVDCSSAQGILQLLDRSLTKMIRHEICKDHGTCPGIMSFLICKIFNWKCPREVSWTSGIWWSYKIRILLSMVLNMNNQMFHYW